MPEATVDTEAETAATAAAPPSNGTLFHRRIESVPAKRQFAGFSHGGGGFRLETLNPATSDPFWHGGSGEGIGPAATVGKKYCVAETMDLVLDPELSFGFTMSRIGAGLENLGNTCFLNSVLQCLTYTEPLAAYLQSGWHKSSCRKAGFCALCAIQNHVNRALQSTGRSLAPKDLVLNLRCISRNFRNARQEDAHEYMVSLLESMHKCCLPSGVPSESPSAFERSLVHKIFGGRLRSQVKCMQCAFCSDKFDPFLDLSLEIDKVDSLQKALAHFTAKEYLDGGASEYQCQRCKQKVKALKQLSIQKAPYVLNIHLKRFGYHQPDQKIDKKVHFGSTLDLKPFVTGAYDGDLKYTLYGVLVHYGENAHSGHYSCFVRTSSGMWYSLDDHRVCNVSEKRVLEEKAYMLFYVRDRKNFIPKKPVDVVHAKNMIITAMGNRMQSDSNQVCKKIFQNGPTDKRAESSCPSFALPRVDVAVAGSIKENLIKEKSIQGTVQETVAESSSLEKEVQLNTSSVMPVVKDDVKSLSSSGDCSTQSTVANGSGGCLNNPGLVATNNVINETNKERSTNENPTELVVAAPNSNCLQNLIDKNHPSEMANTLRNNEEKAEKDMSNSFAVNPVCNGIDSSSIVSHIEVSIPLKEGADKESKMVNSSSQVEEPEHENVQNGCLSKESSNGDCAKDMEIEPSRLSGLESAMTTTLAKNSHKSQRKLKKKFSKRQITMTHLSSSIILGAVFSFRKKKHKKVKRSVPKIDILAEENLGPSTSEFTRPQAIKVNSRRKGSKLSSSKSENISTAKNGNGSNGNLLDGFKDEKLRDRVSDNDAAVATGKPAQCVSSSALARNSSFGRESNTLKVSRRDSMQNVMMNMLTRGLQETIVARWDEMERPSSLITERSGREPFSIGYIGDDCDEEYDKGKRKKVKTSIRDFRGPNPFQEIATKKAKLKKPKLDRSSSANQPFRI